MMQSQQTTQKPWFWFVVAAAVCFFLYSSWAPATDPASTPPVRDNTNPPAAAHPPTSVGVVAPAHVAPKAAPEVSHAAVADLLRRVRVVEHQLKLTKDAPEPEAMDGRLQTVGAYYEEWLPLMTQRITRVRKARGLQATEAVPVALKDSDVTIVTPKSTAGYPALLVIDEIQQKKVWAELESSLARAVLERECQALPAAGMGIGGGASPLMVDTGAHIGYFSTLGLNFGCDVVYIEPFVESTLWFQLTLAYNGMVQQNYTSPQAYIYNAICSDQEGSELVFNGWNAATHTENKKIRIQQPVVNQQWSQVAIGIDTAVAGLPPGPAPRPIALWKMDIEGHEPHGFASAAKLLKSGRIHYLLFECTYYLNHAEIPGIVEMFESLAVDGFALYEIWGEKLTPISTTVPGVWKQWYAKTMENCKTWKSNYCQTNFYAHLKHLPPLLDVSAVGKVLPVWPSETA